MTMYVAYNCAFDATTGVMAGTSYTTGAKVAIQLATPATVRLKLIEIDSSWSGTAAGAPTIQTVAIAGAASTVSTAHSTSTVVPIGEDQGTASNLTFSTTTTGYGNGAITTNTTARIFDAQQIGPTTQYFKQWPLGREPIVPASSFCQVRVNTAATLTGIIAVYFEEC